MIRRLAFAALFPLSCIVLAQDAAGPDGKGSTSENPAVPVLKATGAAVKEPEAIPVETPARAGIAKPLGTREAADSLTEEELRQVIDLLRANYIQPGTLSEEGVARAGLQGLLDRLGSGARIYGSVAVTPDAPSPLRSEVLEGSVGYLRFGSLSDLGALDSALEQFALKPPTSLVLDLRATPHSTDFELAAEVCRRFAPKGRILFSVKRPKINDEEILTSREDPRWRGQIVVLVDADTAGAAEVVAAVLRTHLRAYIIGQQTRGEAAQFEDLPLPSGKVLRVAVGEVTLPDNSPVFPGGLRPDLLVPVPQEKTDRILALALTSGVAQLANDKERPRMNEAALVAGTNPELDAAQERQKLKEKGGAPAPELKDETLQRALDYITTVRIYEAGRVKKR